MKYSFLIGLTLVSAPVWAQTAVENVTPLATQATSSNAVPFITGLGEAQGLALSPSGDVLVADYKKGQILRFSQQGQPLGVLVSGLKSPSLMLAQGGDLYVSERKGNRVIKVSQTGRVSTLASFEEPLGITLSPNGQLTVVAHTTSKLYRLDNLNGAQIPTLQFSAPADGDKRYGYRAVATLPDGSLLLSDETDAQILKIDAAGRASAFATGFDDPSGVTVGPDGAVYVADEGRGGQLVRVSVDGQKTVVAEKLGRPRGILFLNNKTALVSNRDGSVWKVSLP
jgi:virginiamycin B lyase